MANSIQKFRRHALSIQQGRCFYCDLPIWERDGKALLHRLGVPRKLARYLRCTAEHLQARQDGGRDIPENIVAACFWCNHQRHAGGHGPAPCPETYRAKVRRHIERHEWHPVITLLRHSPWPSCRPSAARLKSPAAPPTASPATELP